MADSKDKYPSRPELDDQDPFAELTRIMGFDPRAELEKAEARLEKHPLRAEPSFEDDRRYDEEDDYEPVSAADSYSRSEEDISFDEQDFALGDLDLRAEELAPDSMELDLGSELDRAFASGFDEPVQPQQQPDPFVDDNDPLAQWASNGLPKPQIEPMAAPVVPPAPRAEMRSPFAYSAATVSQSLIAKRGDVQPTASVAPSAPATPYDDFDPAAVDEPTYGDEPDLSDEADTVEETWFEPQFEAVEPVELEETEFEDEPAIEEELAAALEYEPEPAAASPARAELSIEDELAALLGDDAPAPRSEPAAYEPDDAFVPLTAAAVASRSFRSTPVSQQVPEPVDDDPEPEIYAPEPQAYVPPSVAAAAAPLAATPVAAAAVPPAPVSSAPKAQTFEAVFDDFDTVDIEETVRPVQDDLDLPDLPEPDAAIPAPAFDDLATELEGAFDSLDDPYSARPAAHATNAASAPSAEQAGDQYGEFDTYFDDADGYRPEDDRYDDALRPDEDLDDYNAAYGDDAALAAAPVRPRRVHSNGRRRTMALAAAVAAVVLVGGVGAWALFSGGDGSDDPVLIAADSDPVRVRPENPGGTVVPNQDSEAYQRVSGADAGATPSQDELITTAEEPVDVAERAAPRVIVPGVTLDEGEPVDGANPILPGQDADALSGTPKFDERIENVEDVIATAEPIAVEPRRVRTMVVRPDGTIVPREEPAAAPQVAAADPAPVLPDAQAGELSPPQSAPDSSALAPVTSLVEPGAQTTANPDPVLPQGVNVAPTQRPTAPSPQQTATVQPATAAQQPATQQPAVAAPQQVAAATPPATSAATSEWSMQIASQPTAESAQSTYQDLARRYGNVLQGRGVNIVRAEIDGRGTYYRVRIPASNREEAVSLCASYQAAGGNCFVSR